MKYANKFISALVLILAVTSYQLRGDGLVKITDSLFTSEVSQGFAKKNHLLDLKKRLDDIPQTARGEIYSEQVPWIYTNDHEFYKILPSIETAADWHHQDGKLRVAIVSGAGSLINIARFLNVDAIISIDCNNYVLEQVQQMVEMVKIVPRQERFLQLKTLENLDQETRQYWEMEKDSFGQWHFLANNRNYSASRHVLLETPLLTTQGNLTFLPYIQALVEALEDVDIVYASFTDLGEWHPDFFDLVGLLPMAKETPIVWSTNIVEQRPEARLSFGLDEYIIDGKSAAEHLTVSYFK